MLKRRLIELEDEWLEVSATLHRTERALAADRNQHASYGQLAARVVVARPLKRSVRLLRADEDKFGVGAWNTMRVVFSLLILCLLWNTPILSQTKTDRDRAGLVGPVKSVKAYLVDFFMKDGRIVEGKRRPLQSTTYNSQGNISEKVSYDHTEAITAKYTHTYDAKGWNTGYEEYFATLDKSLSIPRRHVYTLDEDGRKLFISESLINLTPKNGLQRTRR
jgi:hypothetical protein